METSLNKKYGIYSIAIPAIRNIPATIWYAILLIPWLVGEILVVLFTFMFFLASGEDKLSLYFARTFLMIFTIGWTIGGILVIRILCWFLGGKEEASVDFQSLKIRRSIFGIGKNKQFKLTNISKVYFSEVLFKPWPLSARGNPSLKHYGNIVIENDGEQFRFGIQVNQADANHIIDRINERLPQQ